MIKGFIKDTFETGIIFGEIIFVGIVFVVTLPLALVLVFVGMFKGLFNGFKEVIYDRCR